MNWKMEGDDFFFLDVSERDKGGSCQTMKMGVSCNGGGRDFIKNMHVITNYFTEGLSGRQ